MKLVDARRLMGPSHLGRAPLVVVELELAPAEGEAAERAYLAELATIRAACGFAPEVSLVRRPHAGGVVLGYEAPIDVMLACTEMSEHAALSAAEILAGRAPLPMGERLELVRTILQEQASPRLLAIAAEAARRGLPFSWDDHVVLVGLGRRGYSAPRGALPAPEDVPWGSLGAIPVVMITGTNGKTTSSRLVARMASEAGLVVGATSSDGITVGGATLEEGDWTGPVAARTVLCRPDVELAVLETARGGILRRGLAIASCDVALLTNVSDDHMGGYGIHDLAAMTEVKAVVARAVPAEGTVVLNAHDPKLVALAETLAARVTLFADLDRGDDAARDVVARHRAAGGETVTAEAGAIVVDEPTAAGRARVVLARVEDAPLTFGGAARYNVENVLGAVGAARALGLPEGAITRAIVGFGAGDNPRRGELALRGGVRVLLDFGHNPEGVKAVMSLARALLAARPGRLFVVLGSAGDRTDHELDEMTRIVCEHGPARVVARELEGYLRGRAPGETPEVFRAACLRHGLPADAFDVATSEVDALGRAFAVAAPGDLVVVLVHLEAEAVRAFLSAPPGA